MDDLVRERLARQRFSGLLMGVFAAAALLLAAIGIYGGNSYWVSQRAREIGIRIALGAERSTVLGYAIGRGLKLVGLGVGAGLAVGLALSRLVSGLLYGVSSHDPWTLGGVSLLLFAVGLLASYIPARRCINVDPVVALRCERGRHFDNKKGEHVSLWTKLDEQCRDPYVKSDSVMVRQCLASTNRDKWPTFSVAIIPFTSRA